MNQTTTTTQFAFRRGWLHVMNKDMKLVRREIMKSLKIETRMAFHQRMTGKVEPKVTEAKAIEAVFARVGLTDIWGWE